MTTNLSENSSGYYDPTKDECTLLAHLLINSIFAGVVCALGLAGNALSFCVLRRDHQTPVASYLLQALALTDSFFLALWFMHFSITDILAYARVDQYSHRVWIVSRLYTYPLLFIGQTATIWLTVLIASTRFVALCLPYKAATLCTVPVVKKSLVIVAAFSVIYNIPRFVDTKIVHVQKDGDDKYYFAHTPLGSNKVYHLVYFDILYYIFSFVLPLLILSVLNLKLTVAYRRLIVKRRTLHGDSTHGTPERHRRRQSTVAQCCPPPHDPSITLVMIVVVLVFMLCNLPARLVQMVWKYREQQCMSAQFVIKEISGVMEVLNSSTNFIIYCVFRQQFRQILFGKELTCCLKSNQKKESMSLHCIVNPNVIDNKLDPPQHI